MSRRSCNHHEPHFDQRQPCCSHRQRRIHIRILEQQIRAHGMELACGKRGLGRGMERGLGRGMERDGQLLERRGQLQLERDGQGESGGQGERGGQNVLDELQLDELEFGEQVRGVHHGLCEQRGSQLVHVQVE